MIDLCAWLPFWLLLPTGGGTSFGFVRAVRLVRVFRVFKFGKYSMGIQMFAGALKNSLQPLAILVIVVTIAMVILSSIMYMVEMTWALPRVELPVPYLACRACRGAHPTRTECD